MAVPTDLQNVRYTDTLDPDDQIDMEERIAYHLFDQAPYDDSQGLAEPCPLSEEWCADKGREILVMVLAFFRPDLTTEEIIPAKRYDPQYEEEEEI